MVQVRQQLLHDDGSVDIDLWLHGITQQLQLNNADRDQLFRAAKQAQQWHQENRSATNIDSNWQTPTSSFFVGLEMTQILADLHLDIDTLTAAVLYRVVCEEKVDLNEIEKHFGEKVARLIKGVLRMAAIGALRKTQDESSSSEPVLGKNVHEQVDSLRKMLLTIIDDVRVALIKIAERTCIIRSLKDSNDEERQRVAREVMDIYAPLAHRLGLGKIKWELEDIAFRYLETSTYQHIAKLLDEKRVAREHFVQDVVSLLQEELKQASIKGVVSGRVKHIYSIWQKMREKDIGFSQVYDVRAVRILVTTVHECYMALGIVHKFWRRIPNEFDDYIASPKENGYRSLHTAVIGPEGKVMEIQIRTQWMHEEAEFGVCAHWQYKAEADEQHSKDGSLDVQPDNDSSTIEFEEKVEWLRQVLEWHEDTGGDRSLIDELRSDIIHEKIYVFTPEGDVVELQQGATPLDFAYHVHTGVGHRCRGARVNGRIVPLSQTLQNSDQVDIITGKHEVPNREWLAEGLGYIQTSRSRSKIHQWFRQQAREQNISEGSISLDRELKRLALIDINLDSVLKTLSSTKPDLKTVEDLYAAIGASDIDIAEVISATQNIDGVLTNKQQLSFENIPVLKTPLTEHNVMGVGSLPVLMASCCSPHLGDLISGVIDQDNAVIIHQQDCGNALQIISDNPASSLQVEWGAKQQQSFLVDVEIEAYERSGLLRDIAELFDIEKINIVKLHSESNEYRNTVFMSFTVEIISLNNLSVLLAKLNQLPNIYIARRRR